jgi:hypothetical protein
MIIGPCHTPGAENSEAAEPARHVDLEAATAKIEEPVPRFVMAALGVFGPPA